jgi:hypothetical protein
MWRTFASLGLMFVAIGWSAFAVLLVFLIVPGIWEPFLGPTGGVVGALLALVGVIWTAGRLMRWADRLLQEQDGDHGQGRPAQERVRAGDGDVPRDWHTYNAEIARSKRWAFYRRTRQFERLAEMESEAGPAPGAPSKK